MAATSSRYLWSDVTARGHVRAITRKQSRRARRTPGTGKFLKYARIIVTDLYRHCCRISLLHTEIYLLALSLTVSLPTSYAVISEPGIRLEYDPG